MVVRYQYRLYGVVQGIGLRPMVANIARQFHLSGHIYNTQTDVRLEWQGCPFKIQQAFSCLSEKLKNYGKLRFEGVQIKNSQQSGFDILPSKGLTQLNTILSPDTAPCSHCVQELFDPINPRYLYPFITCAQCGPRYTITKNMPFDRKHTAMQSFPLCHRCQSEYDDPSDIRYHAQTLSCPECGPMYRLFHKNSELNNPITNCIKLLLEGKIIAIKGVGGFHFVICYDAINSIKRLRKFKERPHKPFAICANMSDIKKICHMNIHEYKLLQEPGAPIVVLKRRLKQEECFAHVAPRQNTLGVMLPPAPIYYILLRYIGKPLIVTSANYSGEPLIYKNDDALKLPKEAVDYILTHNRYITTPLEDSVLRIVDGKKIFIRRSRGYIPFALPYCQNKKIVAVGGHLKNTIAFSQNNSIQIMPYIGSLNSVAKKIECSKQVKMLNQDRRTMILHDVHPHYGSTHIAKEYKQTYPIYHHHAHIFGVMAEHGLKDNVIGFAWDGAGLGEDNTIWGGESFLISNHKIARCATLLPFDLIGGDQAARQPTRILYALLKKMNLEYLCPNISSNDRHNFDTILDNKINVYQCSSIGRVFDAVSGLLINIGKITYEGQAAIELEQLASCQNECIALPYPVEFLSEQNMLLIDWRTLLQKILYDLHQRVPQVTIAYKFHMWCANVIVNIVKRYDFKKVVLSGGVFQNKLLIELVLSKLQKSNYKVFFGNDVSCNDSGLAIGQIYAYEYLQKCV